MMARIRKPLIILGQILLQGEKSSQPVNQRWDGLFAASCFKPHILKWRPLKGIRPSNWNFTESLNNVGSSVHYTSYHLSFRPWPQWSHFCSVSLLCSVLFPGPSHWLLLSQPNPLNLITPISLLLWFPVFLLPTSSRNELRFIFVSALSDSACLARFYSLHCSSSFPPGPSICLKQ